jgi:hypothetical protein
MENTARGRLNFEILQTLLINRFLEELAYKNDLSHEMFPRFLLGG